jgi:hypothetical protein
MKNLLSRPIVIDAGSVHRRFSSFFQLWEPTTPRGHNGSWTSVRCFGQRSGATREGCQSASLDRVSPRRRLIEEGWGIGGDGFRRWSRRMSVYIPRGPTVSGAMRRRFGCLTSGDPPASPGRFRASAEAPSHNLGLHRHRYLARNPWVRKSRGEGAGVGHDDVGKGRRYDGPSGIGVADRGLKEAARLTRKSEDLGDRSREAMMACPPVIARR